MLKNSIGITHLSFIIFSSCLQAVYAEVTLDGSLGSDRTLTGPDYQITESDGQVVGDNLFHSFNQFSLDRDESATFSGSSSITNIISRVTGQNSSQIDGAIISEIPDANFFLINPNGVHFGENATLNIDGSFYTSTADYIALGEEGRFHTSIDQQSLLTTAPPSAFGFLDSDISPITVSNSQLHVPQGESISLVGGNITISGDGSNEIQLEVNNHLQAPSGDIKLISTASSGEVSIDGDISDLTNLGDITVNESAMLSTTGNPGGTIYIRSGNLVIENSVTISETIGQDDHSGTAIDISVQNNTTISNSLNSDIVVFSGATSSGRAGDVSVESGTLTMQGSENGTVTIATTADPGSSGASGHIEIDAERFALGAYAYVLSETYGEGNSGKITIDADHFTLDDGIQSFVSSTTYAQGHGGDIVINSDEITMLGGIGVVGLYSQVNMESQAGAEAGDIIVNTSTLSLGDGAQVNAAVFGGSGAGGNITVNADNITISGTNQLGFGAGFFTESNGFTTTGDSGSITVNAGTVTMSDLANISAFSASGGDAGNIDITLDQLSISNGANIGASSFGSGNAGDISIEANNIDLTGPTPPGFFNFTGIFSIAGLGGASAGDITIDSDSVRIADGALINNQTSGPGAGGTIHVSVDHLQIYGIDNTSETRSGIVASNEVFGGFVNFATGDAGEIIIDAQEVGLSDQGEIVSRSTGFGNGGDITVNSQHISLSDHTSINSSSVVGGDAGNITLNASNSFTLDNSSITTETELNDGGNIAINVSEFINVNDSAITTSARGGEGRGGNIDIDPHLLFLRDSQIAADAVGGPGGNITLVADNYINDNSTLTASSELSLDGVIQVNVPNSDITGEIEALPDTQSQPKALLKSACMAKQLGANSLNIENRQQHNVLSSHANSPYTLALPTLLEENSKEISQPITFINLPYQFECGRS